MLKASRGFANLRTVIMERALHPVQLTYKVTSIADNAFANNKKLTKVTIGSNVTTIGKKAFYKCTSPTKITIPAKVNKIGKQAFYGCKKLKNITIKTTKLTGKNVGSKAFKDIYAKATIKVPKSKLTSYKKLLKSKGSKRTRHKKRGKRVWKSSNLRY